MNGLNTDSMLFNSKWLVNYEDPDLWESFREGMLENPIPDGRDQEEYRKSRNTTIDLFKIVVGYGKIYTISNPAKEIINRIKVDNLKPSIFSEPFHPNTGVYVAWDEDTFFRFFRVKEKELDRIYCAKVWIDSVDKNASGGEVFFDIFSLDIVQGFIDGYRTAFEQLKNESDFERSDVYKKLIGEDDPFKIEDECMRVLVYLYFSDLQYKYVKAGKKYGTRKTGMKNASDKNVFFVDANWNIVSIRKEDFTVSGHFRLQPYGPGMSKRKLIYIDEFLKHGYVRRASKDTQL